MRDKSVSCIVNGDSVRMPFRDESVDFIITSPPYPGATMWSLPGESIEDNIKRLTKLNHDVFRDCVRVLKKDCVIAWNIADIPYGDHGIIHNASGGILMLAKELGLNWRNHVVWDKGSSHLPPPSFMRRPTVIGLSHEHVYVFFKGGWVPREKKIELAKADRRWSAFSVWKISTVRDSPHLAPFPYELARRCIEQWSLPGEIVFDPFLGSGTTGQAALDTGRKFLGLELLGKYCSMSMYNIHKVAAEQVMDDLPLFGGNNEVMDA